MSYLLLTLFPIFELFFPQLIPWRRIQMNLFKYLQRTILGLVLVTTGVLPANAGQPQAVSPAAACISSGWPWSRSDLKADPSLITGTLANGFRYILKVNKEPKDRVAVYLDIQAGSLNETEEQRGYAHFLEHMLFNGSTHFKPGELVDYFQSIGMSFGGDTNAHTGFDETVYNIILPSGEPRQLEKGLLVMADYARGALLLESEIERERGVILSEKRSRDSADYRAYVAGSKFAMRGTRMPDRMPIGVDETLKQADHRLLKDFYDAWYRPENMILVVVGDFRPEEMEPLLKKHFEVLTAGMPTPPCPDFGTLQHKGVEAFYHHEEELGRTDVSIETVWEKKRQDDSLALEVAELNEYAAAQIIKHRLQPFQEKADTPFTGAEYASGDIMGRIGYGAISAQARPGKWQQTLQILEHQLRQAFTQGFQPEELDRVKKEIASQLQSAVLTSSTRDSKDLAAKIIRHLNNNRVWQSPEQERELYGPVLSAMTLEEVNAAFRTVWSHESRLLSVSGNTVLPEKEAVREIQEVYEAAGKEAIAGLSDAARIVFPYLKVPEKGGQVVAVIPFKAIGAERLVFANGVTVNLKKTDFQKNEVQAAVHIGHGRLGEPRPGLTLLAGGVVNGSGSGRLQRSQFDEVLAGSTVEATFRVGETGFIWSGKAVKGETERLFQVLHSLIADPGLRQDVFMRVMRDTRQAYVGLERDVHGPLQLQVQPFLAGNDPRFGMPPWSEVEKLNLEQLRQWLLPELQNGSLELSVVGDFDREELVRLAGRYFGSLSPRQDKDINVNPVHFPAGKSLSTEVKSSIDKSVVVVAWPTSDFWDIGRTRRLHMLASVFDDRLRKVVREKLGATYSPEVYSSASRAFKGYGLLMVQMTVQPGREQLIIDEVLKIAADLRQGGVSQEELERAKAPMMTSLKDTVRSNDYWLSSVLSESTRHSQQLLWPTSILSDFNAVTRGELSALAAVYLDKERVAIARVQPARGR